MIVSLEARERMPKGLKDLAAFDHTVDEETTAKQEPRHIRATRVGKSRSMHVA